MNNGEDMYVQYIYMYRRAQRTRNFLFFREEIPVNTSRVVISIHPVLLAVHSLDNATPSLLIAAHPEM